MPAITALTPDNELWEITRQSYGTQWMTMNQLAQETVFYEAYQQRQRLIDRAEVTRLLNMQMDPSIPSTMSTTHEATVVSEPMTPSRGCYHIPCRQMAAYAQARFKQKVTGVPSNTWAVRIPQSLTADMLYDVEQIVMITAAAFENQSGS